MSRFFPFEVLDIHSRNFKKWQISTFCPMYLNILRAFVYSFEAKKKPLTTFFFWDFRIEQMLSRLREFSSWKVSSMCKRRSFSSPLSLLHRIIIHFATQDFSYSRCYRSSFLVLAVFAYDIHGARSSFLFSSRSPWCVTHFFLERTNWLRVEYPGIPMLKRRTSCSYVLA